MTVNSSSIIRLSVIQEVAAAEEAINVYYYNCEGETDLGMLDFITSWWTEKKTTWRAVMPNDTYHQTLRIVAEDLTGDREFAEYAIPVGEQSGTRSVSTEFMPTFNAVSVKLVVPTRRVRPGGKRFACLVEADSNGQALASGVKTAVEAFMTALLDPVEWGTASEISSALCVYGTGRPVVTPAVAVPVTGYLVDPYVSSQVSRKNGRGS